MDLSRWIPALRWLPAYDRSWLRGDFVAGLTLAAYLLPAASEMHRSPTCHPRPASTPVCSPGWSSGFSAAPGTRPLRSRPPSPCWSAPRWARSPVVMPARFGALAAGTAILVAVIALIAWAVRAGAIVNFISESVMVGFKCGVALFLASTQLPKLFGIHGAHGDFWQNTRHFLAICTRPIPLRSRSGLRHSRCSFWERSF